MTYPYSEPLFNNYLFAYLTIDAERERDFRTLMCELIEPLFEQKLHWKLVRAGCQPAGGERKYLHIWQMPVTSNLWEAMYSAAGNSSYAKLNQIVKRETQDLMRLAPYSPIDFERNVTPYFGVAELGLKQDWRNLVAWREHLLRINAERKTGPGQWPLLATFRPQTGDLRRQLHVWQVEERNTPGVKEWERQTGDDADKTAEGAVAVERRGPIELYDLVKYACCA